MNEQKRRWRAELGTGATSFSCMPKKKILAATSPSSDRASEFKMVVAYDHFGNGICARRFIEGLVQCFEEILTFVPRLFKFEELLRFRVGERLAREVAVADMVVFVADEYVELPDFVENWIRTWEATTRIEGHRLLALFSTSHRENDRVTPVQWRLRQAARRSRMKFVLQAAAPSKTVCRVADADSAADRQMDACRGKKRSLRSATGEAENVIPRTVAGGTIVDLPRTAVTDAIIEVMRARQARTSAPTTLPVSESRAPSPEINQKHALATL